MTVDQIDPESDEVKAPSPKAPSSGHEVLRERARSLVGKLIATVRRWAGAAHGRAVALQRHPLALYGIAPFLLVTVFSLAAASYMLRGAQAPTDVLTKLTLYIVIQGTPLALLAMGTALVLAGGGVDISTAGVASLAGVIYALSTHTFILPWSVAIGITSALLFGALSGSLIGIAAERKRSSLIVSWAFSVVWTGAALILASRHAKADPQATIRSVRLSPETLPQPSFWQWHSGWFVFTGPSLFIVCLIVLLMLTHQINLPRQLTAVGGDRRLAEYAGVRVPYVSVASYVLSGMFSAIAGVMWAIVLGGGSTVGLIGRELIAISVAVLGGTVMNGGYLFLPSVAAAAWFWALTRLMIDGTELSIAGEYQTFIDSSLFASVFLVVMLLFGRQLAGRTFVVHVSQEEGVDRS
jgi:ribose/xylose/arabinose/galactoside ABC-type transport system permease subunit